MSFLISPLRYPGGKSTLIKYLSKIIQLNSPIDTYVEPFAGGAGAALGLLYNNYVKRVVINDADEFIFKFWQLVLNNTNWFIEKIQNTSININEWKRQRLLLKKENASDLEIGFATFYLNRCNRSGILTAGPIGGYKQLSDWKIDARFNKDNLIERIKKVSSYKDKIDCLNFDAVNLLKNYIDKLNLEPEKTLIYLDPPYFEKGPMLYRYFYCEKDHKYLHNFLKNETEIKWVLSYDDVPFIHNLYKGNNKNGILVNHFAYKARVGKELLISSDNCILPE